MGILLSIFLLTVLTLVVFVMYLDHKESQYPTEWPGEPVSSYHIIQAIKDRDLKHNKQSDTKGD